MSRHFERLNKIRREDPDRLERLQAMRPGRRATSTVEEPPLVACRLGWYWSFYTWPGGPGGEALTLDNDLRGLDSLYQHARGESAEPAAAAAFTRLVEDARADFEPDAEIFRQQQVRPRMSPPEEFILKRLDEYAMVAPTAGRDRVSEIRQWVLAGEQKTRLQQLGRRWRKTGLPAATVFHEVAALWRRSPPRNEELGDVEVSAAIIGHGTGARS